MGFWGNIFSGIFSRNRGQDEIEILQVLHNISFPLESFKNLLNNNVQKFTPEQQNALSDIIKILEELKKKYEKIDLGDYTEKEILQLLKICEKVNTDQINEVLKYPSGQLIGQTLENYKALKKTLEEIDEEKNRTITEQAKAA